MRRFQCALLATVAAIGFASVASAADMPVKAVRGPIAAPVYDWSGFYLGGQVGGGWSHTTVTNDVVGAHFFNFLGDSRSMDASAFLGGLFVGAQQQFGSVVVGIEGGSAWGRMSNTVHAPGPFALTNYNAEVRDLYYITGKLGYAFDRVLVYGKGGWATASVSTQSDEVPAFNHFGNSSARHNGYVVGAGLDYAWTPNVIVGLEYNYYDLRTQTHVGTDSIGFSAYNVDVHPTVSTVMARLSYKFGWTR